MVEWYYNNFYRLIPTRTINKFAKVSEINTKKDHRLKLMLGSFEYQ